MFHQLRTLAARAEDPGLMPSTEVDAHNILKLQLQGILFPFSLPLTLNIHVDHKNTCK